LTYIKLLHKYTKRKKWSYRAAISDSCGKSTKPGATAWGKS